MYYSLINYYCAYMLFRVDNLNEQHASDYFSCEKLFIQLKGWVSMSKLCLCMHMMCALTSIQLQSTQTQD